MELTGKELVGYGVGLIIKSLVSFSEIMSSFLFRKFLLCLRVEGFICASKIYSDILQQQ